MHIWRETMNLVWILTVFGNAALCLLLVIKEYYIRFNWLTISAGLSVGCDFLLWWCHTFSHPLYEPLRLFIFYALFPMIEVHIIVEAFFRGERRIRIPIEFQLFLVLCGFVIHKVGSRGGIYFFDCGTRIVNVIVILFFISLFRKEPISYVPQS